MAGEIHGPSPTFGQHRIAQKATGKPAFIEQGADPGSLTKSLQLKQGKGGGKVPVEEAVSKCAGSSLTSPQEKAALQKVMRQGADVTSPWLPAVPIARLIDAARPLIKMQTGEIDLAPIISQSTLGSTEAKVLLEFLIFGTIPSAKDITLHLLKGLLISKDKILLAEARNSLQKIFLGISQQLQEVQQEVQKHPPINPEQDKLYEILVGDLLTLDPFLEAHSEENPVLTIPQKVEGKWTTVTYNVAAIELAKELKATSPIYAYGLQPKGNEKASPLLLFMGTPPPTITGADIAIWVDVIPDHTVGEALYNMSKKEIEEWVNNASQNGKKPVHTYGKSLGGAMCLLTSVHCGNKVVAHAYNPPGLHERMLQLHEQKYKDTPESERPVMYVYSQEDDLVSELIGKWPEGTHYYKIIPAAEQKSSLPIIGRYLAHIQSFLGKRVLVLELTIENVNKEDRRIAAASIVQRLCRIVIGGKTENVRQKVVGNYDWASTDTAEKLPDSSGKKRKRADLAKLFNEDGLRDVHNHLHIALADEYTYPSAVPLIAGWGKVAVRIGVYQHVILNVESLSKRLGVSTSDIKEAEKKGTVDTLIKEKLNELKQHPEMWQTDTKLVDSRITAYTNSLAKAEQNLRGRAGSNSFKNYIRTIVSDHIRDLLKGNPTPEKLKEYLKFVRDLHLEKGTIDIDRITAMALANQIPPPDSLREVVCTGILLHIQEKLKGAHRPTQTKNDIRDAVSEHIDSVLAGSPSLKQLIDCLKLVGDLQLEKGTVAIDHSIRALRSQIPPSGPLRESLCKIVLLHIQAHLDPKASPVLLKVSEHIRKLLTNNPDEKALTSCLELIGDLHLDKGEVDIVHIAKALANPDLPPHNSLIKELRESVLALIGENLTKQRGQDKTKNIIVDAVQEHIDQSLANEKEMIACLKLIGDLHLEKGNVDIEHSTKTLASRILPINDPFRETVVKILQADCRQKLESGTKISSFLTDTRGYRITAYRNALTFFKELFENEHNWDPVSSHADVRRRP